MPETSIVIRAYNEERHLPALFEGIAAQTYRDFETVVVDSGSFDLTRDIAQQHADRLVRIKTSDFTFGHSLNAGIEASGGRFIVIVSAHTRPVDEMWLANLVEPLRNAQIAMVYGRQCGLPESKLSERADFERTFGPDKRVLTPPNFFANNANSAVQRTLWSAHPFDETLPGLEDIEFAKYWMEAGYQVVYQPDAAIYHIHNETWPQVRRRYYREGQAAKWIGVKRRRDIPSEIIAEAAHSIGDVIHAARDGQLGARWSEILQFRWNKLYGTVAGIYDGGMMENPMARQKLLFDRQYKAAVIHGARKASLDIIELPALKPSEVLVRVAYQGVCATDIEIFEGELGYYKHGMAKYPIVPGHEFSGVVASVGSRVTEFAHGDRVVVECIQGCGECERCRKGNPIGCSERREVGVIGRDGGYAQYMISPVQFLHHVPAEITLKQACLCEPLAVVHKGLRRLEATWGSRPGRRTCAVVGVGPIGHLTARVLAQRGHRVTAFDRNPKRLALFEGSNIAVSDRLEGLDQFDALVEATGHPDTPLALLEGSAAGATILLLGLPYGRREFSFETIVGFDKCVVGSVGSAKEDFAAALETLNSIDTSAFLQKSMPLADFQEAWDVSRRGEFLKVVLEVDGAQEAEAVSARHAHVPAAVAERA